MFFAKIPKKYAKNTRCCVEKGKNDTYLWEKGK